MASGTHGKACAVPKSEESALRAKLVEAEAELELVYATYSPTLQARRAARFTFLEDIDFFGCFPRTPPFSRPTLQAQRAAQTLLVEAREAQRDSVEF